MFKFCLVEIFFIDCMKYLYWIWGFIIDFRINILKVFVFFFLECYNIEVIFFIRCLYSEIYYIYILYFIVILDNFGKVEVYFGVVFVLNCVGSFMKVSEEKDWNIFFVWWNIVCKIDIWE